MPPLTRTVIAARYIARLPATAQPYARACWVALAAGEAVPPKPETLPTHHAARVLLVLDALTMVRPHAIR